MIKVASGYKRAAPTKSAASLTASFAKRRLCTAIISVVGVMVVMVSAGPAFAAVPLQLVYRVSHSMIGNLGSYSCTVEPRGNGVTEISTHEHIDASVLGIPLYRMDAAGTERWQGNRLVSFHGVTENPSGRVEVRGEAQGSDFVIMSPQSMSTTAGTVHPAEPCAPDFLQSTTILRPDTGGIEQVRISGGAPASVVIDGNPTPVRKYILDGKTRYTAWLDSRNVPVMFAIEDGTGEATFTLARCVSGNAAAYRPGTR